MTRREEKRKKGNFWYGDGVMLVGVTTLSSLLTGDEKPRVTI